MGLIRTLTYVHFRSVSYALINGQGGNRTLTALRPQDFKSCVYTIPPLAQRIYNLQNDSERKLLDELGPAEAKRKSISAKADPLSWNQILRSRIKFQHQFMFTSFHKLSCHLRRESELNRRIAVLQTAALPLGYRANNYSSKTPNPFILKF